MSGNRYFGKVALAFAGSLTVKLAADNRRVFVPAHIMSASGLEFEPGDRIELSLFTRGDGTLIGCEPAHG